MKRAEEQDDMFQNKRQRLEGNLGRPCYTEDSARLASEWADDELDCALEEVCIIAELTQRPANQANAPQSSDNSDLIEINNRLKEKLKTKDGEVAILRSQLQQQQVAKQNENSNYRRSLEDMEQKYKTNLVGSTRQVEKLQSELEFKDLEVKGLREKCKQLELKRPAVNFVQPGNLFSLSQAINTKHRTKERQWEIETRVHEKDISSIEEYRKNALNEGEKLSKLIDPSFFRPCKEDSVFAMYSTASYQRDEFDYTKDDKYKWIGLPQNESFLPELHAHVVDLMRSETFSKSTLNYVLVYAEKILQTLIKMLTFFTSLPKDEQNDRAILKNTCPGRFWNLGELLSDQALVKSEHGVEARRVIALMSLICQAAPTAISSLATEKFFILLAEVIEKIGKCRRQFEYSSVCIATLYFLRFVLANKGKGELEDSLMMPIRRIIGEIIMTRSKLDVIRELFKTWTAGAHHSSLVSPMCKRSSSRACALYMDARLQQAIFFTREVCPLKLLQFQVKTLSFLCKSKDHFIEMLNTYTMWLQTLIASSRKPQIWLFSDNDNCCDLLESLMYLLYLCTPHLRQSADYRNAFEAGIAALRNCCKGQKKKFKFTSVKLLSGSLRFSGLLDILSPKARANALFVINEFEKDIPASNASLSLNASTSVNVTGMSGGV